MPRINNQEDCTMTSEEKKALVQRLFKALDANDTEVLLEVLSPDLVVHNPDPQSREDNLRGVAWWHTVFSGSHLEILEQVCEGDVVATRVIMHADHTKGEFQGVRPTGKHIAIPAVSFERIESGKIVERRIISDRLDMMQQLGLAPASQASS
jgi:predicted ester cyclase